MNKKSGTSKDAADKLVNGIRRKTRKQYSAGVVQPPGDVACHTRRPVGDNPGEMRSTWR